MEVMEGMATCGARISCIVTGISPALRFLRFEVGSWSESLSEIWARIVSRSGVKPGASEEDSESEDESEDEDISVDESDESEDSSSGDVGLFCDALVIVGASNWMGSLF